MPAQSLDLTLDPASDDRMRANWQSLEDLDIPSEGRRTSASHRPHLTVLALPQFDPELLRRAAAELCPLLPLRLDIGAAVVFGRGPFVVSRLVTPSVLLRDVILRLRAQTGVALPAYVPHLTISRKVPSDRLTDALGAAARMRPTSFVIDQLRHWDPGCRTVTTL